MTQSNQSTIGATPRLWIKRLAIFESREKRDAPIRDIAFHRGLNIVWGVELPDDPSNGAAHPVTLSGHSVGKTTLCRLIRYCLGESKFGNAGAISRIRRCFSHGCIGMELEVEGRQWAVLKPIGQNGTSKAFEGKRSEDLFDLERRDNQYQDFVKRLSSSMMSGLQTDRPPNSDKPYEWQHLLAWLTRDQEARFQSLHEWRSPRSESDTPSFKKSKVDALYLIRLVLDLIQEKELQLSQKLGATQAHLDESEGRSAELRRGPDLRFAEHERSLKELLNLPLSEALRADEGDMTSPIAIKRTSLERQISGLQTALERLDRQIAENLVAQSSYDEEQRRVLHVMGVTQEGTEEGIPEDPDIQKLRELMGRFCEFGKILFDKCDYVQQRRVELEKVIDLQKEREEQRVASEMADRREILEQKQKDHEEVVAVLNRLRASLQSYLSEKRSKEQELARTRGELDRLEYHVRERQGAFDLIQGKTPNTPLREETERAAGLRKRIEEGQAQLETLQAAYAQQLRAIGDEYDALIKRVLSPTYSGSLRLPKGELQFWIEEETGLSGEAVETLGLVLADVTAAICSCRGIGHHPRFLLHDSPREADLDRHIYSRFLREMWSLTTELGGPDHAPFQYIVTTTTRPPEEVRPAICLELEAHPETNMLFRRLLRSSINDEQSDFISTGARQ